MLVVVIFLFTVKMVGGETNKRGVIKKTQINIMMEEMDELTTKEYYHCNGKSSICCSCFFVFARPTEMLVMMMLMLNV